jgi:uncharacterized protein (TIGR02145 family)
MTMQNKYICLGVFILSCITSSCDKGEVPAITTSETTNISGTGATSGGTIVSEGSGVIISRGVCWSKSSNPSLKGDKTVDGAGAGTFSSELTGLNGATIYFVRAYATNEAGTGYGMAMSFTTLGGVPLTLTWPATVSSPTTATLTGEINANYISSTVTFEYGTSTSYGNTAAFAQNPVTGNANTLVIAEISGLVPETSYHFRIKAVNSIGTTYGEDMEFTTFGHKPTVGNSSFSGVSATEVALQGTVNPNYMSTVVTFEYGTTTDYGNSIPALQNPLSGGTNSGVNVILSGLSAGSTYHFRIKAVNQLGITYGEDKSFSPPVVTTDIDGNIYPTIIIGTQTWMTINLKVTRYNDGTNIPLVTDPTTWSGLSAPGYCWYENDEMTYKDPYGALYNWYAVNTGNLCPLGWHVPSDDEWTILTDYLGGLSVAGGKLKNEGTAYWDSPNTGATNETQFSAMPAGYRTFNDDGKFFSLGLGGTFWCSNSVTSESAWSRAMLNTSSAVLVISNEKRYGTSVRCLKD